MNSGEVKVLFFRVDGVCIRPAVRTFQPLYCPVLIISRKYSANTSTNHPQSPQRREAAPAVGGDLPGDVCVTVTPHSETSKHGDLTDGDTVQPSTSDPPLFISHRRSRVTTSVRRKDKKDSELLCDCCTHSLNSSQTRRGVGVKSIATHTVKCSYL